MKIMKFSIVPKVITLLLTLLYTCVSSSIWSNHDISTLKLLQIVHRHGDRAPYVFTPNDPFSSEQYWPEGIQQLTPKGKYRMFKRGQFIRDEYDKYLGDKYSPREVYARSSITDRCVESVSCLLSGAYPPKQKAWQWNEGSDALLGQMWQPFPIQTFMPKEEDSVLNQKNPCKAATDEQAHAFNRKVVHDYLNDNREFFDNLTKIAGTKISDISSASALYGTLAIEVAHGYHWTKYWTKEEELDVIKKLEQVEDLRYTYQYNITIVLRLRSGGLVRELNNNFQKAVDNDSNLKKVYVYSTHDTQLAVLMQALNIFNNKQPPFGASLYLELHESDADGQWVRAYYHNETLINGEEPHLLTWNDCRGLNDCPLNEYFNATKHLLYDNYDKECNELSP